METIISIKDLVKIYGTGETAVHAVDHINLDILRGEIILIMGPSGSGKTTLLSMIGGILKPTSGQIFIEDKEITHLSEKELPYIRLMTVGFVFQSFNLLSALTALENVQIASELCPEHRPIAHKRALEMLQLLGLEKRMHFKPDKLSGGEKQRVSFARALANDPKVILADEPTANLDSKNGADVMHLLHNIAKEQHRTVVIVSHDQRIKDIADRVLWLEDGKITEPKNS